ncbi:hypothetical protein KI387_019162 [Taxus chinensis]|uniref:Chalcone-flavonone isomerase family protein n=1 Tax=Taxus chinensis TaxID=29808 RepID=A0AA38G9K2_TAXCH|nr:hypothetical protein KI387_019162 [Taxus chinensis]
MEVEGVTFSSNVKPVGSDKQLILGGAGVRGLEVDGKFIKFTAIGIYLEEDVLPYLALKWKNKTAEELGTAEEFFMDIVTCPYEKYTRVTLILPLSGTQYSEKVSEGCKAAWEAAGIYGEAEDQALEQFKAVFNNHNFPPGSSIQFTHSPASLVIAFSKDSSIPEKAVDVIENSVLSQGILASIIGKNGVSPLAKASIAERLSTLYFPELDRLAILLSGMEVDGISFSATIQPPGYKKEFLLGGAGFRGLEIEGKFRKFTTIGIYMEKSIISHLALTWKGKATKELNNALGFFMDIVTCHYEKFAKVSMIAPLSGTQYSEKVSENCQAAWEAAGIYGEAEAKALEAFKAAFKDQNFPPGSSILFTVSPAGLVIAFTKDSSIPEKATAVIDNRVLGEAVLASMIGENGVSPSAKASLADRLSQLLQ